ncbi:MAG: hypothetical protein WCL30_06235, partial [Pseudomonadota bacterium]
YKLVGSKWQESTELPDPANKIDISEENFHKAYYEQALSGTIDTFKTYNSRFFHGVPASDQTTRYAIEKHFADNKIDYARDYFKQKPPGQPQPASDSPSADKPADSSKPDAKAKSTPPAAATDDNKDNDTIHNLAFAGGLVTTALAGFSILNGKEKDRSDKEASNDGSWVKYVAGGIGVAAAAYGAYKKWGGRGG